ncbi:hypothetical protein Tco_1385334 [Tanacetum coccineum]
METNKPLTKEEEAENVDVHLYRSMIGSLMYLIASRPDIMFAVCACARFQVTPKTSHLHAVKRIFRYLKGQPKLGLWYPKDSPFDLEAYSDSDCAGASLDRKSTIGGCQFLGKRLISWQCKKQTIVANSKTEAAYVAAANCFLPALTMKLSLPVGTTYLLVGTYTLPVGTTYLLVVTNYYNIPNSNYRNDYDTVLEDSINVLKLEVRLRDNALDVYKLNLEKAEAERDQLKQTLEKFQNSSKSLNEILECQVIDKFKKGLGYDAATAASPAVEGFVNLTDKSGSDKAYHAVPPPLSGNFLPGKPDLTFIDEIVESENLDVTTVVTPSNEKTVENKGVFNTVESNTVRRECCAPINEELVSDGKKKTVVPTIPKVDVVRPKQQEKPVRKTVKYAEMYRSQKPRGNQRNWNNQKSQQLGNDFVMHNKACYVCGSFDHLQYTCKQKRQLNGQREEKPVWNNARRVNHQNSPRITHPNPKRHMVPRKILTRSGPISLNTARQSYLNAVCCCCSRQVNTARQKAVVNAVRTNRVNAVKASACWVWRPVKPNSASITLKKYDYGNPETKLEDLVRLNSPKDEKRAGAELTQQNDKSQYKKLHGKLMLIEKITSEVNAAAEINAD